ncbi:MAG: hypothetical protein PHX21_05695 [bacterium]|nr:hypothetical protein [bacterium]
MHKFMFGFLTLVCPCLLGAADSLNIHLVGYSDKPWISCDVKVLDPYAYIASYKGFYIMDISTPSNPDSVGSYTYGTYSLMQGVAVVGSYAYVVSNDSGLTIIDISTPSTPTKISSCNTPGEAFKVEIAGSYAYVADGDSGLRIIDISTPSNPFEAGFIDTIGIIWRMTMSGSYAYTCGNGLRIIDISTPANPAETGLYPENTGDVAVLDTIAYATTGNILKIINVADASNPTLISSCTTSGDWGRAIAVSSDYAYIATSNGLHMVDVSDPLNPTEAGYYENEQIGYTNDITVSGQYIYLADSAGLHIFSNLLGVEETEKKNVERISIMNNPVHCGYIDIRLQMENSDNLSLSLVDIAGRKVKEFQLDRLNRSKDMVRLSVKDVETGVYFITDRKNRANRYSKAVIIK